MEINSEAVTSKRGLKLIDVNFWRIFFNGSMQGRVRYQLDPATSSQEHKCAVYRTLPVLFC